MTHRASAPAKEWPHLDTCQGQFTHRILLVGERTKGSFEAMLEVAQPHRVVGLGRSGGGERMLM